METEDYFSKYAEPFRDDLGFSRDYSADADRIVWSHIAIIHDYERHDTPEDKQMDLAGYDREIRCPKYGIRVRREYAVKWAEFTVDEKEWRRSTEQRKYYFFAYASSIKHAFKFWMIFDYTKLKRLVEQGKVKAGLQSQERHSGVNFHTFKLRQIFNYRLVLCYGGSNDAIQQIVPRKFWGQQSLWRYW